MTDDSPVVGKDDGGIGQIDDDLSRSLSGRLEGASVGFTLAKDGEVAKADVEDDHEGVLSGVMLAAQTRHSVNMVTPEIDVKSLILLY